MCLVLLQASSIIYFYLVTFVDRQYKEMLYYVTYFKCFQTVLVVMGAVLSKCPFFKCMVILGLVRALTYFNYNVNQITAQASQGKMM